MPLDAPPKPVPPLDLLRPGRGIFGASAILLPFEGDGSVDWRGFEAHVDRTARAGLVPAVNMDTGYVNLVDHATQDEALDRARSVLGGSGFFAGAFVLDRPGDPLDLDAYRARAGAVESRGGTPVVFPSFGLTGLADDDVVEAHRRLAEGVDAFVGFELGRDFSPAGRIYGIEAYRGLMGIARCLGAKHSSLSRDLEWQRLRERDRLRPDFRVFTGNDLAIDMVMYGSDYLLGLSTCAPDHFADRDRAWASGDPAFYPLNDLLQYLGFLAFRPPVPAYKHSAAMMLHQRGWIATDRTHPLSPTRPDSDRALIRDILDRLDARPNP